MRYLFAVIDTQTNSGTHEETVAIDEFNDKIGASGQRLMAAGLAAPRDAKIFDNRDNAALTSDGPINQTHEYMSGFWIIDAATDTLAHELAAEASKACNRRIEVRRFL
jgi:hypothetical protein